MGICVQQVQGQLGSAPQAAQALGHRAGLDAVQGQEGHGGQAPGLEVCNAISGSFLQRRV